MSTHGSVAAGVSARKKKYPHLYCAAKDCLWRVFSATTGRETPCPRHPATSAQAGAAFAPEKQP